LIGVAGTDPDSRDTAASGPSNLALRVVSSLVLAPLAVGIAWLGGWPFVLFWGIAAALVLWEWSRLAQGSDRGWHRAVWIVAGLVYAGVIFAGPVILRSDAVLGFVAIVFLFAIVWVTDVCAYFAGRAVGGPKLWAAVSPKKTWSGAIGGTLGALATALSVVQVAGLPVGVGVTLVALTLSVVSQLGDLLESAIKRHFGAKDASQLIPGHGGLMDRLDGFLTAVAAAVMVGLVRGGFAAPAQGLLIW
jgi:phosphatidate cytidylyltransferase